MKVRTSPQPGAPQVWVALGDRSRRRRLVAALAGCGARVATIEPSALGQAAGGLALVDGAWLLTRHKRPEGAAILAFVEETDPLAEVLAAGADDCLPTDADASQVLWRVRLLLARVPDEGAVLCGETRRLFSRAPALIATTIGPDHRIDFANSVALECWGADVEGRPLAQLAHAPEGESVAALLDEVMRTDEPCMREDVCCPTARAGREDAEVPYFSFVYLPRRDAAGRVIGTLIFGIDVTSQVEARIEAERLSGDFEENRLALEQSERMFRLLAEAVPQYVWIADENGEVVYVNQPALTSTGATFEQIRGAGINLVHPDDRERVQARVRHSVLTGEPFEAEFRAYSASRRTHRWGLGRALPQRDPDGRVVQWVGTLTDIDDQKRASEADARLAALVASSPDAIVGRDTSGRIVSWNDGATALFGYTAKEAVGKDARMIVPPHLHEEGETLEEVVRSAEMVRNHRSVRLRKDGSLVEVSMALSPIVCRDRGFIGIASVYRDVSENERMRAKLAMTDRLVSVGTLAAGVAHEVNNPLSYIAANLFHAVENLRRDQPEERMPSILEALEDARQGVDRIRVIVRDLKVFSRSEEDRVGPVDLTAAVRTVLTIADNEIRHRAQLVTRFEPVPPVNANEARVAQMLLNLVINAAQAIKEGAAERNEIRVSLSTGESGEAVFEIEDTGEGIPAHVLPRIFDPFFTTKPVGFGTGLGLYVCHGIVEKLGGHLSVDSREGEGTRFRLVLPSVEAVTPSEEERMQPAEAPRRARVAIIDDDPLVCNATRRLISGSHDVEVFSDAREALARLVDAPPDVVLCDLMMPSMGGEELHEALLERAPALAGRMIFLTGGAFTPESVAFCDRMTGQVLEKPIDVSLLLERIRLVLEEERRDAGAVRRVA